MAIKSGQKNKITDFSFKIAGEAGYGIMSSGLIFAKIALRSGYFVFDFNEYPSLIRGGHNVYTVRVSKEKIFSQRKPVDFLVALNQNAVSFHKKELTERAAILLNTDKIDLQGLKLPKKVKIFPIPLIKLAKEVGGEEVMMNNVALGATLFLLQGDFEVLASVIKNIFAAKKEVIELNIRAAKAGFDFAKDNFSHSELEFSLSKIKSREKILVSGNDAICLGAVKAGCKFVAIYPMTPINSILAYFAKKGEELGIVYFQPEDEIAGINSAIGASHCGVRSMVATSGGGFSLMVEGYGLAGMTETPLVIVLGQRPGPATGLPTWTGQGDLRFVLHAHQDDFPRIVLAPGDPEECFYLTAKAFNLADIYQTAVVILIDKHLAESHLSVEPFDQNKIKIDRGSLFLKTEEDIEYRRYKWTNSGISPRAIPGKVNFTFIANSDEHNEFGFSEEDTENRKKMMEKRMRKLEELEKKMPQPKIYGKEKVKITLVGWGSLKGAILEAQKILKERKIETNFLHLNYLNPFPTKFVSKFLKGKKNVFLIEQNYSGQLAGLIRERTGINIENRILKYDGRPFYPEEIVKTVENYVRNR